uniref:Pre-PUA domain-containing protein n=1 Tax=Oncorhynchus tshawytscha TaxID=74940 RepID=A0A8C8BTI5_ONCTS
LFDEKENVSNCIQLKTSVIKCIKNQLLDQFPDIESRLNHLIHEHIEILTVNGELLFFRQREGPFYPTLRLLHKCKTSTLFDVQVLFKLKLSLGNIQCDLGKQLVYIWPCVLGYCPAIVAEGKQYALCVRVMKMSAENIEKVNKGGGVENVHYLNDGLWHMKTYKCVITHPLDNMELLTARLPVNCLHQSWRL